MTERIPQLLDLQRGAAYLARQQAVIAWAQESLANIRALVADLPRVATALNVRGENAAYDALVRANERVRRVVSQVQADGWRQWVAYALREHLMDGGVGPEVPDSVGGAHERMARRVVRAGRRGRRGRRATGGRVTAAWCPVVRSLPAAFFRCLRSTHGIRLRGSQPNTS